MYSLFIAFHPNLETLTAERPARPATRTPVERQLTRMLLDPVGSTVGAANKPHELHISDQSASATLRFLGSAGSPHFVVHAKPTHAWEPKAADHRYSFKCWVPRVLVIQNID